MHDGKTIMSMCLLPFVLSEMHRRAPVTWIGLVIQSETRSRRKRAAFQESTWSLRGKCSPFTFSPFCHFLFIVLASGHEA